MREYSPTAKWCLLRSNSLLRMLIKARMDERKLSMRQLALATGIHYDCVQRYLRGDMKGANQFQVVRMADYVGIKVSINIEFKHE